MCTNRNKARVWKSGCSVPGGLDIQMVKILSGSPRATASRCQQPEMILKAIFKNSSRLHCGPAYDSQYCWIQHIMSSFKEKNNF